MGGMSSEGVIVKLGGSVVTEKDSSEPKVRRELVSRLAAELVESEVRPLVLVHGAGSYGHQIVERTGIHLGISGAESLLDWGETQRLQYVLDCEIAELLLAEGLPVMPCQSSASAVMRDGRLESFELAAVELMIEHGLVPLFYGVPAVDRVRGCSILSGDQIAPFLAERLGIRRLVHGTNVDGVFTEDPTVAPRAHRFDRIDESNWDQVRERLRGSSAVDVTGGMLGKVEALLRSTRGGLRVRIVDATIPGRLAAALRDEPVGTLVTWEEP